MKSDNSASVLCEFDADTRRCHRCGYLASQLPYFRVCRNLEETARQMVEHQATHRVAVPPVPLGDAAAAVLKSIGITKERLKAATGKDCGCDGRQKTLNRIGAAVSATVERAVNGVLNAALPHPVDAEEVVAVANALAKHPATNPGLLDAPATVNGERNSPDAAGRPSHHD